MIDKCRSHEWEQKDNYDICIKCKKQKLHIDKVEGEDDIMRGIRKDGKNYTMRRYKKRYFFPDEWVKFYNIIDKEEYKILFLTLLNTGARIMEVLHLKCKDIDMNRLTITFRVIKHRVAKANNYSLDNKRTFYVTSKFLDDLNKYIKKENLSEDDYIFMDNEKLPENYADLSNKEKTKSYNKYIVRYNILLKRYLKKIGIEDYKLFSLHNIRKTYGNWMRIFEIQNTELAYRMGHDIGTYMNYYGSSLIFTDEEKRKINKILGEVR